MSGKTTVGQIVAEKLGRKFIDTDRLIENAYRAQTGNALSCREIFKSEGEKIFRALEKQQIGSLSGVTDGVVALGGGCLADQENIACIGSLGNMIYLQTSPSIIWERIRMHGIPAYLDPLAPEKAFYKIAEERMAIYEAVADVIVNTSSLDTQAVAAVILRKSSFLAHNRACINDFRI